MCCSLRVPTHQMSVKIAVFPGYYLLDWISDTRSQGYTDLQSLVKCLDHRNIVSDTACSQARVVLGSENSSVVFASGVSFAHTAKHAHAFERKIGLATCHHASWTLTSI